MSAVTVEQRLDFLESIVKKDRIILTDSENPNERLEISFEKCDYRIIKISTQKTETNQILSTITNE